MLLCKFSPITSGTWVLIIVQSGTFLSAVVLAPRTSDVISFSALFWEQTAHFSLTLETNLNLFSCLEMYYWKLKKSSSETIFQSSTLMANLRAEFSLLKRRVVLVRTRQTTMLVRELQLMARRLHAPMVLAHHPTMTVREHHSMAVKAHRLREVVTIPGALRVSLFLLHVNNKVVSKHNFY